MNGFGMKSSLRRLARDRQGNFAIMTALLAVPLIFAAGTGVDLSGAYLERTNMQAIADSAALAGGRLFDGTNFDDAKAETLAVIKSYPEGSDASAYDISYNGRSIVVSMKQAYDTTLSKVVGIDSVPLGVTSTATSPLKPKDITFTPTQAQGWYWKKVSIRVVRPGSTAEEVVGTVTYQPTTHANNGQGTMTVTPTGKLDLGTYSKLILQQDIKNDGCELGKHATMSGSNVACNTSTTAADQQYNLTLRTDNPDQSYYLFVNGVQLAKGVASPLDQILGCDKSTSHAWEDGGGWDRQDFFYTVMAECTTDGQFVRLTQ